MKSVKKFKIIDFVFCLNFEDLRFHKFYFSQISVVIEVFIANFSSIWNFKLNNSNARKFVKVSTKFKFTWTQTSWVRVVRIVSKELENNTYLVIGKFSALIDPSTNTQKILRIVKNYKPKYIILTHTHFDHVFEVEKIKLVCGAKTLAHFLENFKVDEFVEDRYKIKLGDLKLEVLHTPGHTPGSICLYEEKTKSLFSGDTVFSSGSFGRTDLPGGSLKEIIKSLEKLSRIDVEMLYPGHGDPTRNAKKSILTALKAAKNFYK